MGWEIRARHAEALLGMIAPQLCHHLHETDPQCPGCELAAYLTEVRKEENVRVSCNKTNPSDY